MIHRIDRVNPDVDDRVIKPNEARGAVNLRFGASTEDTNLSGGTLILGNTELSFLPPSGTNRVVGVYSDLEARCVYFALCNKPQTGQAQHGIYRINGNTNAVQAIATGEWLGFLLDDNYDVSLCAIENLLYWTDNVNEPRMININKGILTIENPANPNGYKNPSDPKNYTQIKRPPGVPLDVYRLYGAKVPGYSLVNWYIINTIWTAKQASKDYNLNTNDYDENGFGDSDGYQFSYYYVYDNDEESCLAPWTDPVYWKKNIVVQVPEIEFNQYVQPLSIIKKVVFVYRINNDGVPFICGEKDNNTRNYVKPSSIPNYQSGPFFTTNLPSELSIEYSVLPFSDNPNIQFVIKDLRNMSKTVVASDITDRRFDSVPLVSKTNTIAQNRINHGNYVLDRNTWGGLDISLSVENVYDNTITPTQYISNVKGNVKNIFRPGGLYEIGIELLDVNGRPIGVVANKEIEIPKPRIGAIISQGIYGQEPQIVFNNASDDMVYNTYKVKYKITGTFPSWAAYARVVSTGAKNINYFYRGLANIFYWFQSNDGANLMVLFNYYWPNNPNNRGIPVIAKEIENNDKTYTYKGIGVDKMNMPVNFSDSENMYLRIAQEYLGNSPRVEMQEFKIVGQMGNILLVETSQQNIVPAQQIGNSASDTFSNPDKFNQLWYNIEVYSKRNTNEAIFYQSSEIRQITNLAIPGGGLNGYVLGDCYTVAYKKILIPSLSAVGVITPGGQDNKTPGKLLIRKYKPNPLIDATGVFIAMNPSNSDAQVWVKPQGQEAIINENQREVRIGFGIIFSGIIIQGTQVNGLNKFNSLDSRLAPAENGPITALVTTNATQREPGVMLAIGTYGISSFYYNAIQLTNVDGSENVTTTDAYLASQRPLLGQYGCSRPMSVTKTPLGTVYWWSDVVNDLIRYTNAGLERLGLTFSFGNFLRRTYNDNPLLITWYDQVTDEIILSGQGINPDLPLRAAVFSERYKTFQGQREYFEREKELLINYPERATGLPTKQYYFINGRIFVSDVEATGVDNNFLFGEYKNPALTIVTNEAPASVKQWNQIKVFGAKPTGVSLSCPSDSGSVPLVSSLSPQHFIERKGDYEAAIRRAENTTGGLLAGKIMESRIIYSTFAFDANTFVKLNFVEIKGNTSIVQ